MFPWIGLKIFFSGDQIDQQANRQTDRQTTSVGEQQSKQNTAAWMEMWGGKKHEL